MESVDASKNIVGFDIDLKRDRQGPEVAIEIKNTAWDGIFAGLEGGAYDAILSSVTITDDRKKRRFLRPVFQHRPSWCARTTPPKP